jgi:micrococcal nuclease
MRIPKKRYLIPSFVVLLLLIRFISEIGHEGSPGERFKAIQIIDGDTIELTGGDRLRLLGLDTPEKGDLFSDSARAFLGNLILGKNLNVVYGKRRRDGYGRLLGYIFLDSIWVNKEIIRNGLASLYLFEDNLDDSLRVNELLAAQNEAMESGRGIWSLKHPEEPYYVAKKGSFRFHRPDCRSVRQAAPEELIRFSSRQEPFRLGYSPCRNCRP